MSDSSNYQNEINRLKQEVEILKSELQTRQLSGKTYKDSMETAERLTGKRPSAKDINPILNKIRGKNLSLREKSDILFPELYPSPPFNIYYQWVAKSRLTVARDRQWYWILALLLMIIIVLATILDEFIWIAVALAFFFAIFVYNAVPAEDTIYRLTKQGVEIGEGSDIEIYSWDQMLEYSYYFKNNTELLVIETLLSYKQRVQILFSQEDRKKIDLIMSAHLMYKHPPKKQNSVIRYTNGVYIPYQDFQALQEKIDEYYDHKYSDLIQQMKKEGRIPQDITVEDIRNAENAETMKIINELRLREDELNQIAGL